MILQDAYESEGSFRSCDAKEPAFDVCSNDVRWTHDADKPKVLQPTDARPAMPMRKSSKNIAQRSICFDERLDVHIFETEEPVEALHWTPSELSEIYRRTRKLCRKVAKSQPEIVKSIQVSTKLEQEAKEMTMKQALAILVRTGTRGLECLIEPSLSEWRVDAVQELLDCQEELVHKSYAKTSVTLRSKSIRLSRASREFAWRVAQADAAEARKINEHSDDDSSSQNSSAVA